MGKDPAVLWYWNDWHGGTVTMSRFLKGCYVDLLYAQFNNGHLSMDEIKTVLGSDFGSSWSTLQKKFKQDPQGLYYNERLVFEIDRRKNFSKKQKENGLKGGRKKTQNKASSNPDESLLENENINENEILNINEYPQIEEFLSHCKDVLLTKYPEYEFSLISKYNTWVADGWKDGNGNKIKNWKNKINNTIPYLKPIYQNGKSKASSASNEQILDAVRKSRQTGA